MPNDPDDELDAITRQLEQTPDDLRALRADELDAIVPERADAAPVYSRTSAERIYRLIIEQMREGAVLTPSGADTIIYCNGSFASMVEQPTEHIVGDSLLRWLEPLDGPPLHRLLRAGEATQGDYRLRPTNGSPRPVSISATTVLEDDRPLRCLIVNDLRMRRDVERLQQVRAELELSHQRKNEFLAMLGHELRNPLAPVRQASELLEAHAEAEDPEYLVRARQVLARQVVHLTRLVDDLLDVGRVTKGTLAVDRRAVDVREAIATARESVERLIGRRQHALRIELPAEPVLVEGDVVRLTQVFANLLSNAAKYTPDGGNIEVSARREGETIIVRIRDDGQGIDPALIPYLFEPFVQSEATLGRSAGGIGVGLTLVRRIVELHDGEVSAHSAGSGHGASFVVSLPAIAADQVRASRVRASTVAVNAPAGAMEASRSTPRILVVDDNEDAAQMLALVLRKRGYEVRTAFDGQQTLELAGASEVEVVLLDIGLPDIDGFEVARRLRAAPAGRTYTLVALTGYGQPHDRERALAAGFDHHLVKPVAIEKLLTLLPPSRPSRH
ncbi:MAG: ATP-binding protein [Nannocystaceae bacterium]